MPAVGKGGHLHHRGEHQCGTVKGFGHTSEELYVPRANWTESASSPLKSGAEFDAVRWVVESRRDEAHRGGMKRYLNQELGKQVQERDAVRRTMGADNKEIMHKTMADAARKQREDDLERDQRKHNEKAFKKGLDEQAAHNAGRMHENRLQEAYEGAEIKLRTTQQLCHELAQASRQKDQMRQEMANSMKELENTKLQQRVDRHRENSELRRTISQTLNNEQNRHLAQQQRVKDAMAAQEACYKHFASTTGAEEQERREREGRRQDRDEQHHQMRTDMHYAQREMARERQRQRMRQTLDNQLNANAKKGQTHQIQLEYERSAVHESMKQSLEGEMHRLRYKRSEELENQASLVAQMHEKQQRDKRENPSQRVNPATATMLVTPALLASAESWRGADGGNVGAVDLSQRVDASKHLDKPMGKPEVKNWVDISKSYGAGGVVGVFGSDGPTRSLLMSTGGPGRLLTKAADLAARDRQQNQAWHEGLTADELRVGKKAAAKRHSAAVADKAVVPA